LFGPHTSKKLLLGDHHARALEERGEDLVRSAAQPNRLFPFQQKPLVTKQTERPKGKFVLRMRLGSGHRFLRKSVRRAELNMTCSVL
jgi:hypothetical protein